LRRLGHPVVAFSEPMRAQVAAIRRFLFARMYRAPRVMEMRAEVTAVVQDLFATFLGDPALLPAEWQPEAGASQGETARAVADYIAGMTDRFALQTHRRLCPGAARGVLPTRR
jgi:dGTPase